MTTRNLSVLAALALASAACGGSPDATNPSTEPVGEEAPRGPLGKADAAGSCAGTTGSLCGGKGSGSCYCDDACQGYGDCCADYEPVCKGGAPPSPGGVAAVSCAEAGDICNASPAGAAVYRLYREALRADGKLDETDVVRLGAFLRGSGGRNAAVAAFIAKILATSSTPFAGGAKALLQAYLDGNPAHWVPLDNPVYRVQPGTQANSVLDDAIYLVGEGSLSASTGSTSHSRGYAKKAAGILRFPHGSKAPAYPSSSSEETQRLRSQSPSLALDTAASTAGLNLGAFGFVYRAEKRFYDPNAQYWEGLCHAWSYGALDERINALVDVPGPSSRRGVWIHGQWLSRADLGNWMMGVSDQLGVADTELVDPFVTPRDILLGVTQWVMTSGLGLRADMFNDTEQGASEVWNQPIVAADLSVESVPQPAVDAVLAHARNDPKNSEGVPAGAGVKLVRIRVAWGAEVSDSHEGDASLHTSDWNMYFVTGPDGKVGAGYMAHHLRNANVSGLPVTSSDALPDYFAYPKNAVLDAAFEGAPSSLLKGALDGGVFRFFVGTVLAYGIPDTMRASFEADFGAGVDAATLAERYPGIANAYSPAQWEATFAPKLGAAEAFGARWGKFINPG